LPLSNRATRVYATNEIEKVLITRDVQEAVASMLSAREPNTTRRSNFCNTMQESLVSKMASTEATAETSRRMIAERQADTGFKPEKRPSKRLEESDENKDEGGGATNEIDGGVRDEGVPDEIWAELEAAKEHIRELEGQQQEYLDFCLQHEREKEEAACKHEEELKRIRQHLDHEEHERALQEAEEVERQRRLAVEKERQRREEEDRRRMEELRKREEIQHHLHQIRPCPMGFSWYRQGCGWRCGGGTHFVSDAELKRNFASCGKWH